MDTDRSAGAPDPVPAPGTMQPPEGLTGEQEKEFAVAVARTEHAIEGHAHGRYKQELSRSIGVLGNILITLSGVTPAASVFIIAPVALVAAGSGSFWSFVFAAIVGVLMAFCWAELGAAFPIAGGDYALVGHSFKGRAAPLSGPVSFITYALGAGTYLAVVANIDPRYVGAAIMIIAAAIATLKIRFNAVLTGIFLGIEMAALLILTVLGLSHARNWHALAHPVIGGPHGALVPVAFSGILALTAVAIFSYNGYANAVNFAEETAGPRRNIARAILWSLVITVLAELVPFASTIIGAPDLATFTRSAIPLQYFIESTANAGLYDVVS